MKINFNLSEHRDKEGQPGDVITTHMATKTMCLKNMTGRSEICFMQDCLERIELHTKMI